jgi:hypothetical protein
MNPVPGAFDAHDPDPREQPADAGFVLGLDVVGAGARDEQCSSRISSAGREVGKADDLREVALDRFQVQAPMGGVFINDQILQQESALGGLVPALAVETHENDKSPKRAAGMTGSRGFKASH